jgi:SAM-dependent methyltransferase
MNKPQLSDNWRLGNPYERYVGRWSRRVAPGFLAWLDVPSGKRWLDVGCGTGALCAEILEHCAPTSLSGVEPSEGFLNVARETLPSRVTLCPGNAAAIPLADAAVDAVVSGLVLNFVPDLGVALKEMARVAATGATFGAYVWDYAGKMELMRYFWDAAVALDPAAAKLDEGVRFPLVSPGCASRPDGRSRIPQCRGDCNRRSDALRQLPGLLGAVSWRPRPRPLLCDVVGRNGKSQTARHDTTATSSRRRRLHLTGSACVVSSSNRYPRRCLNSTFERTRRQAASFLMSGR